MYFDPFFVLFSLASAAINLIVFGIPIWLFIRWRRRSQTQHRPEYRRRKPVDREDAQRMAGAEGEEVVAGALRQTAQSGDCYVFRSLREPAAGDIDHLVVGPGGVTLVETKANIGTLTWAGNPEAPMLIDGKPFLRDPMAQMRRQTGAFERRFSHAPASEGRGAKPLMEILGEDGRHWLWCFSRARLPGGQHTKRAHLTSANNVARRIMEQRPLFDKPEVDYIAGRIARAYGVRPASSPPYRQPRQSRQPK